MKFAWPAGDGGHIIPALAVAQELAARARTGFCRNSPGHGSRLGSEAGFPIEWIEIGGFNPVGLYATKLRTSLAASLSVDQGVRFLRRHRGRRSFSMGGYVAGPVVLAAILRGCRLQ